MMKLAALLPLSFALCACASVAPAPLPAEATLTPGQRMALPDRVRLEYVGTYDDSRCPPNVQCIHAGDARVLLRIGTEGDVRNLALFASKQGQPRGVGPWGVTWRQLAPGAAPAATLRVEPAAD